MNYPELSAPQSNGISILTIHFEMLQHLKGISVINPEKLIPTLSTIYDRPTISKHYYGNNHIRNDLKRLYNNDMKSIPIKLYKLIKTGNYDLLHHTYTKPHDYIEENFSRTNFIILPFLYVSINVKLFKTKYNTFGVTFIHINNKIYPILLKKLVEKMFATQLYQLLLVLYPCLYVINPSALSYLTNHNTGIYNFTELELYQIPVHQDRKRVNPVLLNDTTDNDLLVLHNDVIPFVAFTTTD